MSFRVNANGQVESVKIVPQEVVSVVTDRQELVDALERAQRQVAEITQDLADFDALVSSNVPETPATEAAPAEVAPAETPVTDPTAAPATDGGVQ